MYVYWKVRSRLKSLFVRLTNVSSMHCRGKDLTDHVTELLAHRNVKVSWTTYIKNLKRAVKRVVSITLTMYISFYRDIGIDLDLLCRDLRSRIGAEARAMENAGAGRNGRG